MIDILNALGPIFVLILFGYGLKQLGFPGDSFWPLAARLVYFVLFPALLTNTLATSELTRSAWPVALSATMAVLSISLLLVLLKTALRLENRAFTSVLQGSIRHNTYVGLAAAAGLYGQTGLALMAVLLAAIVPLVNVICVTALNYYAAHTRVDWRKTLRAIATNPLILACLLGIVLNVSGLGLPLGSSEVLTLLSRAALPLGLLIVGADLNLALLGTSTPRLLLASSLKLALYPLFVGLWCLYFGVEGEALGVAMLFGALPTATSAYVLALELGGDAPLMAAIITGQTAAAVVTMPLLLVWLSG